MVQTWDTFDIVTNCWTHKKQIFVGKLWNVFYGYLVSIKQIFVGKLWNVFYGYKILLKFQFPIFNQHAMKNINQVVNVKGSYLLLYSIENNLFCCLSLMFSLSYCQSISMDNKLYTNPSTALAVTEAKSMCEEVVRKTHFLSALRSISHCFTPSLHGW